MEKKILRTKSDRWCELQVELRDGRLSICGSEGRIITHAAGRREAREYWESFFEESPEDLGRMAVNFGKRTPRTAARLVLQEDGEFHGLDVHKDNGRLYLTESCGQIRDSIAEWFPESIPYLKYHLNDMHAECVHQEARGETWTNNSSAVCPDCGYVLGSQWTKRELPADVITWVNSLK
jgi:hypothetical protein